jgi:hypothetical protein
MKTDVSELAETKLNRATSLTGKKLYATADLCIPISAKVTPKHQSPSLGKLPFSMMDSLEEGTSMANPFPMMEVDDPSTSVAVPFSLTADYEEDRTATAKKVPDPEMFDDDVSLVTNPNPVKRAEYFHEASDELQDKRLIAFPVFAADSDQGPSHWTLGILYNARWQNNLLRQADHEWTLFHFDSAHCNLQSKDNAISLAQFLTKTDFKKDIKFIDVLVPLQDPYSNNCGLYPAHFLKHFCFDVEDSIIYCTSVCAFKHTL